MYRRLLCILVLKCDFDDSCQETNGDLQTNLFNYNYTIWRVEKYILFWCLVGRQKLFTFDSSVRT